MSKPDLIIGLVGPIGADLGTLYQALKGSLSRFNYTCKKIRLIDELESRLKRFPFSDEKDPVASYDKKILAGNEIRKLLKAHEAVAMLGVMKIAEIREQPKEGWGQSFVLHSIKHPAEVESLREIYGDSFVLVAGYSPTQARVNALKKKLAAAREDVESEARTLLKRDSDEGLVWGQRTRATFHLADLFVDLRDKNKIGNAVNRFFDIFFGDPYRTPNREEYGMFMAFAASRRSAALGRQVGSCITDKLGEVLAVGMNEVPKPKGGSYWDSDHPDHRDFTEKEDSNDREKLSVFESIFKALATGGWLRDDKSELDPKALAKLARDKGIYKQTFVRDLIEFGRCVHAEMYSLMDCARRGLPVEDCTMYVTTFPCHGCTRHIIAAGIKRVVYIEPYSKSLGPSLHKNEIDVEPKDESRLIPFEPYMGVSPRLYLSMFEMIEDSRKDDEGKTFEFERELALPKRIIQSFSKEEEQGEINNFVKLLNSTGLMKNE